jgi:hypothetical protein
MEAPALLDTAALDGCIVMHADVDAGQQRGCTLQCMR